MKERTIFKSSLFWTLEEEKEQKESIRQIIEEDAMFDGEDADFSEERIENRFHDDIWLWYDDEQRLLNKTLPNNVIAIGSVGLWTGTHKGGKVMSNNLNEVLYFGDCDDIEVTYDRYNVHSTMAHHDGRHYMTYRMVKEGVDSDWLLEKQIYGGGLSKNDISRYTISLVPFIKQVYGV